MFLICTIDNPTVFPIPDCLRFSFLDVDIKANTLYNPCRASRPFHKSRVKLYLYNLCLHNTLAAITMINCVITRYLLRSECAIKMKGLQVSSWGVSAQVTSSLIEDLFLITLRDEREEGNMSGSAFG